MEKVPFYKSEWFMWLILVLFFPVGLIMLWAQKRYVLSLRVALTVVCFLYGGIFFFYAIGVESPPANIVVDDWEAEDDEDEPVSYVSADTMFEEEIQPQMEDIIKEYDDIWNTYWKDSFGDNTLDGSDIISNLDELDEQYQDLISSIDEVPVPSSFNAEQKQHVTDFKDYFVLSCNQRKLAANKAKALFQNDGYNESNVVEIESIVQDGDEFMLKAIKGYTELKQTLGDSQ